MKTVPSASFCARLSACIWKSASGGGVTVIGRSENETSATNRYRGVREGSLE